MATTQQDAVAKARVNAQRLSAGWQQLLAEIGIEGWSVVSFRIEPREGAVKAIATCGPGEEYDCRRDNGGVVCGCFPKKR